MMSFTQEIGHQGMVDDDDDSSSSTQNIEREAEVMSKRAGSEDRVRVEIKYVIVQLISILRW